MDQFEVDGSSSAAVKSILVISNIRMNIALRPATSATNYQKIWTVIAIKVLELWSSI